MSRQPVVPAVAAPWQPDPRRWRILVATLVVGFMSLLDVTIVNVALPSIQQGLNASAELVQWVVTGYALAFGLTLVTGGRLGDAYGRRRMMLIGLAGFIAASAAVGLAADARLAVAARLFQGAFAGLLTPQNSGLIQQLFRGAERARAFGAFGFTVGVSSAIGPITGGVVLAALGTEHGWRYLFLINVPIGLLAMVFIARMVPGKPAAEPLESGTSDSVTSDSGTSDLEVSDPGTTGSALDLTGAVLLGLALLALLYPMVGVSGESPWVLTLLVLSPPLAWAFVRHERSVVARGGAPLLDLRLLRDTPGYANGLAVGAIYFTGFTGVFLVYSVFLQEQLDLSPLHAGLLITPFAASSAIAAPVAGRLVARIGRRVTVLALSVMLTGLLGLIVVAPDGSAWRWPFVVAALFVAGFGGGAVVTPNLALTLERVPTRMGGAAGGALQTGQRIGSAIGSALMMSAYRVALAHGVPPQHALRIALATAVVLLGGALALAVRDLRRR